MKLRILLGIALLVSTITLTACDNSENPEAEGNTWAVACEGETCNVNETENKEAKMQIANPASEKCLADGGTLLPKKDSEGGEIAICQLPDGTLCEEWEYYNGKCPGVTA